MSRKQVLAFAVATVAFTTLLVVIPVQAQGAGTVDQGRATPLDSSSQPS